MNLEFLVYDNHLIALGPGITCTMNAPEHPATTAVTTPPPRVNPLICVCVRVRAPVCRL